MKQLDTKRNQKSTKGERPKVLNIKASKPILFNKILQHFVVEFNDKCFVDFWVDFVAFWQASQ